MICTKDRPELLGRCIASLKEQINDDIEVIVVDNSPFRTALPVAETFDVKYVQETRPGSSWARNRGFEEAGAEIVAYIDDDCEADIVWVKELLAPFSDPAVGVVTGSVLASRIDLAVPHLIDTEYPFHRGWTLNRFEGSTGTDWSPLDIWRVGVGGAMAWRKSLLAGIGGFDPALGSGTPAGSSEDIDAFRRALVYGAVICYQPSAVVWHTHPEHLAEFREMLIRYAITLGAHTAKMVVEERKPRALAYLVNDWVWQIGWAARLFLDTREKKNPGMPARALLLQPFASVWGMAGFFRYRRRLRDGKEIRMKRRQKKRPADPPPKSGVGNVEIDVSEAVSDQVFEIPTRVIFRAGNCPVFVKEAAAGEGAQMLLESRLSGSREP